METESKSDRRARVRRPPGYVSPGPAPRGDAGDPTLVPADDEDLSYLAGDFRIFQLKDGHRWSLDDFVTAWVALADLDGAAAHRTLDLGCGIGSVLLLTAWALPRATGLGIEAQDVSAALARRSLRYDGVDDRYAVASGDFRSLEGVAEPGSFDLVTGTPPYIPIGEGIISEKRQRGPCCFETRGGVEDYCATAARYLAPAGRFVVCAGANARARSHAGIASAGLALSREVEVIPRDGKAPLFYVFSCTHAAEAPAVVRSERFVVRGRDLATTEEMRSARRFFGMPPPLE